MNNKIKNKIIVISFLIIYINFHNMGFVSLNDNPLSQYDRFLFTAYFICLVYILYLLKKSNILYISIFIKIVFFIIFLICYFFIEQLLITLGMYSIGGSDGSIRTNIYEDINYVFQWYEVLFWNFIFSLHYPIYIFIFFKPFVNHLDKSIRKIKEEKPLTKS